MKQVFLKFIFISLSVILVFYILYLGLKQYSYPPIAIVPNIFQPAPKQTVFIKPMRWLLCIKIKKPCWASHQLPSFFVQKFSRTKWMITQELIFSQKNTHNLLDQEYKKNNFSDKKNTPLSSLFSGLGNAKEAYVKRVLLVVSNQEPSELMDLAKKLLAYKEQILVTSPYLKTVAWFRKKFPQFILGLSPVEVRKQFFLQDFGLEKLFAIEAHFVWLNENILKQQSDYLRVFLKEMKRRNIQVLLDKGL